MKRIYVTAAKGAIWWLLAITVVAAVLLVLISAHWFATHFNPVTVLLTGIAIGLGCGFCMGASGR